MEIDADLIGTDDEQTNPTLCAEGKNQVPGWSIANICVTQLEYDRLFPGEWLNDTLLDFFLKFITEYILDEQQSQRYFLFSSLFFTSLSKDEELYASYDRVKRWTKRLAKPIWMYDYIFVPIHDQSHWYLAIICNPLIALKESTKETASRGSNSVVGRAGIICLDSGGYLPQDTVRQRLIGYMNLEYRNKGHSLETKQNQPPVRDKDTRSCAGGGSEAIALLEAWEKGWQWIPQGICPEQENGNDCGVFLLEYISHLARHEEFFWELLWSASSKRDGRLSRAEAHTERHHILNVWFTQRGVTHRRQKLMEMLDYMKLHPKWHRSNADQKYLRELFLSPMKIDLTDGAPPDSGGPAPKPDQCSKVAPLLDAIDASSSWLKQLITDTKSRRDGAPSPCCGADSEPGTNGEDSLNERAQVTRTTPRELKHQTLADFVSSDSPSNCPQSPRPQNVRSPTLSPSNLRCYAAEPGFKDAPLIVDYRGGAPKRRRTDAT